MNIVKTLKDCKLSQKQRVFAGYVKDNVDSYICYEKITNRAMLREYLSPNNDFLEYCTAVAAPPQTLLRGYRQVS